MSNNKKRFNVNVLDEEEDHTRNSGSLESGKVLFKKTTASTAATNDRPDSRSSAPPNSSQKNTSGPNDNLQGNSSSQSNQSSQESVPSANSFGKSTYKQFRYLQNTDLYKLPPQPVPAEPQQVIPRNTNSIIVNSRQRGNPILKYVQNVPWEYGDIIPDYQIGERHCVLFLSLRYHNLHPEYIHERLKSLGTRYDLRVILVQIDNKNCKHNLKELGKICLLANCTLILAWSPEEAGRYLETYKQYENKPPDILQERVETDYFAKVQDILTTVKSINKTDAVTLLSKFGSLKNIVNATKKDIEVCTGFGELKAQRLYKVFNESFKRTMSIDSKAQKEKLLAESDVNKSSNIESKLQRPNEHTFLQECLSQKEDSSPSSKKRKKSDDKKIAEDNEEDPQRSRKRFIDYTAEEISEMVSKVPRVESLDKLLDPERPTTTKNNVTVDVEKNKVDKKCCDDEKDKDVNMGDNNDDEDDICINMDDDSDTELELAIEASIAESKFLSSPLKIVDKGMDKNRPSTSSSMSKSDAIYKSGLSTSRHRKNSASLDSNFEKQSNEKYAKEKEKPNQSNHSIDLTRLAKDKAKETKRSSKDSDNSYTQRKEFDKSCASTSVDFSTSSSAKHINSKGTQNSNSTNTETSSSPVKVNQKKVYINEKIRKPSDKNIAKPNEVGKKPSIPQSKTIITNVPATNKTSRASKPISNDMSPSKAVNRIAKNINPSTGKARIGLHAKRKLSESESAVDASKEKENYSQQITNDEFDDLIAHSSEDDDDDDDD